MVLLFLWLSFTMTSCASPAKGISPDAWAYKGYPGPLKEYKKLSNIFVREDYVSTKMFPEFYKGSLIFFNKLETTILTIDGDDGSRYSSWNGSFGGNKSKLGYLKFWSDARIKDVEVNITMRKYCKGNYHSEEGRSVTINTNMNETQAKFQYEFKAGFEYRLICGVEFMKGLGEYNAHKLMCQHFGQGMSYDGNLPLTSGTRRNLSSDVLLKLKKVKTSCYMYRNLHGDHSKNYFDLVYQKSMPSSLN